MHVKKTVKIAKIDLGFQPLLLAPMEDVSDPPFRQLCKEKGADMVYTEFISSEGLIRDAAKSRKKLDVFQKERPVAIQIFGADEKVMVEAARIAQSGNPDIIDINYGCPVKAVTCKGAGASLLQNIDKMVQMTASIIKEVDVPVTVKTRLGWDEKTKNIKEVAVRLQDVGIQALTIHGRTRSQLYKGEADWTLIGEVKNMPEIKIPIFGNGDIDSPQKAKEYFEKYGVDGIMIGRASIGNPWIFKEIKHYLKTGNILPPPSIEEKVEMCKKHLFLSIEWKGERTAILEMRRHYSKYFKGISNSKEIRNRLVLLSSVSDIVNLLDETKRLTHSEEEIY